MRVATCVQASCAVVIYAALVFEPGPRRRLRRRRTVFAFGGTGAATFFVCAIFAATAFGGRPGPPGRHFPRRRRRRRPFVGFGFVPVEMLPSNEWMAEPTSCCTMSRITVTKLLCLGIAPPFGYGTVCSTWVAIRKVDRVSGPFLRLLKHLASLARRNGFHRMLAGGGCRYEDRKLGRRPLLTVHPKRRARPTSSIALRTSATSSGAMPSGNQSRPSGQPQSPLTRTR